MREEIWGERTEDRSLKEIDAERNVQKLSEKREERYRDSIYGSLLHTTSVCF